MNLQKYITVLLIILGISNSIAQPCDTYMSSMKSGNEIVMLTKLNSSGDDLPTVVFTKLNSSGAVIWSQQYLQTNDISDIYIYDDGDFFYLEMRYYQLLQVYKINKETGVKVWQSQQFNVSSNSVKNRLIIRDTEILILTNDTENMYSGEYFLYSLSKGDTPTVQLQYEFDSKLVRQFVQDSNGNIIYAYADGLPSFRIRKISGLNFDAVIWDKALAIPGDSDLFGLEKIFIDNEDQLYVLVANNASSLFKVDTNNGAVLWSSSSNSSNFAGRMTEYKFNGNHLYMSFRNIYVGSVQTSFAVRKINIGTGLEDVFWPNISIVSPLLAQTDGTNQGVQAFDISCDGAIYAAGYCGSVNYGPGAWGVMKIDGVTGAKLADKIIDFDATLDGLSEGQAVYTIDNQLVVIGTKQFTQANPKPRAIWTADSDLENGTLQISCNSLNTNVSKEQKMTLYPNPTKDKIYFHMANSEEIESVVLFSLEGKIINSWGSNFNVISMLNFASGIYIVKFTFSNGITEYQKVIKN